MMVDHRQGLPANPFFRASPFQAAVYGDSWLDALFAGLDVGMEPPELTITKTMAAGNVYSFANAS